MSQSRTPHLRPPAGANPAVHTVSPGVGLALAAVVVAAFVASFAVARDRATWAMEVAPVAIALPILLASWRRWPLTALLYALVALHALVLMLGGAYTYAKVPLGFWLQDWLGLARNPYDKIGHFMQGLVPALVAREVLRRQPYGLGPKMLALLCVCVALAISAAYELVEWGAAMALGQGADEFLGTQGDAWDTQSDMAFAGLGALAAVLGLARWHDAQLGATQLGATSGARTPA